MALAILQGQQPHMFISPAYAQAADTGSAGWGVALVQFAPLIFIFVIFYFLVMRPQQMRLREHRAMIAGVKRGDTVVTGGGLIGKVTRVTDDEVELEVSPNTRVRVVKSTLTDVRGKGEPVPANDPAKG
jgi:preprotein translocase subunit YajC